jgi:hypothetical protein
VSFYTGFGWRRARHRLEGRLIEANVIEHLNMLERGDAHLAINVINVIQVDDGRFASYSLPALQIDTSAQAPPDRVGGAVGQSGGRYPATPRVFPTRWRPILKRVPGRKIPR